jgi:copper chaperone CopZ
MNRNLNPAQSKKFVIGFIVTMALMTAATAWWGSTHPTPESLQVLKPGIVPGAGALVQASISVDDMTCEGCAASITQAVRKLGADEIEVDIDTKIVRVVFRTDKVSLNQIMEAITRLDYTPILRG